SCWVTWIVFWNSSFNFPYKVSPYVGSFGVNTTTYSSEQGNRFGSKREARQCFKNNGHIHSICPNTSHKVMKEKDKECCQSQYCKTCNTKTHYCTSTKRYFQCLWKAGFGSLCGT